MGGRVRRRWFGFAVLCLVAAGVLTAPAGADPVMAGQAAGPEASAPMTKSRLIQRPIPRVCDFRAARYVDGVHPDSPAAFDAIAEIVGAGFSAGSFRLQAKVGDFTGNGVADGVMVVECTFGGNTVYFNAFAYRSDGTRLGRLPVERYSPPSAYPPAYPTVSIRNGRIHLSVQTWRPADPHCCPSRTTTLHLRWTGLKFVPV